jgi:2,4-dienoyl-CoA reductase-like NADH-dependent reductase (Old Yellow Enzyme family)
MRLLFSPLTLPLPNGTLTLPNRIVVAPMCQYAAVNGEATDWHLMHWGNLLNGGAGMFTIEATAVLPEGRITPSCLGLWDPRTEAKLADTLHRARKLAPPTAMHTNHMANVLDAFVLAAQRAQRMGIEAVEIHSAHGYLLHEFLSPIANQRTDAYGGSFDNRVRFPLEVFAAVRKAFGGVLGLRLSASDWVEGGWDCDQSAEFAKRLKALGCDFIHVSSGGVLPQQKIALGAGYQVPFARHIRQASGLATTAVGLITQAQQAEDILQNGDADLVALARAFLYQPRWGWQAAAALGGQVQANPAYWRCLPREAQAAFGPVAIGGR